MRAVFKAVFFSLAVTFCLCAVSSAQSAGRIESMKLVTSDTGWAATKQKVFWTTDGGAHWKDITPKLKHKRQTVSSVFFLDSSTGWILLSCGDDKDQMIDDVCFEFASTVDAGESWSVVHPKIIDPVPQSAIVEDGQGFSSATFLDFADAQHGWAILARNLHVGRSSGEMLRTADGGRTWTQLAKGTLPMADRFHFVNAKDGWMAGGPDQELYATQDAGSTWQLVPLARPGKLGPDRGAAYGLPVFENEHRGFLPVRYDVGPELGPIISMLVLFSTDDHGKTWREGAVLGGLPDSYGPGMPYPSAVTGSVLIAAKVSSGRVSLLQAGEGMEPKAQSAEVSVRASTVDQLSFVSPGRGWILAAYWLLSTSDGGLSWTNITPDPAETVPALASSSSIPEKGAVRASVQHLSAPGGAAIPATSGVSTHLGFDRSDVLTAPQMSTWMSSSPYYDVYIYLPGSPNRHKDNNLTPTWLSAIQGQGWGIGPIWFGLQSTCVGDPTGITQFISTTPTTASTQGAQQADLAIAADQALGISGGIVYLDIENYTVGGTCSAAVLAYVDGFVSEIGVYSGYSAGVYANSGPIKSDISQVSPAPAAIWITKVNNPPQVTVWNQGISDNLWPNGQRMHQFLINKSATFGTIGPVNIDADIDNGPMVNANAIAKAYTYGTPTNISCAGAINTYPTAINDMSNGAFINGSGLTGTVVGMVQTAIGSPDYAFQQTTAGACTILNVLGSTSVEATGINNLGQIVGYFNGSDGKIHGFLLNPGKSPIQVDYSQNGQTANATYLYGINDAGQAVGYAWSPDTFYYQSFMYYGGTIYPLGVSGNFTYTLARAINGQGIVTGIYYYQPVSEDFEAPMLPSTSGWSNPYVNGLTPGGIANTQALGINANNELTGYYYSTACSDTQNECGFQWSQGASLKVLTYSGVDSAATGINDFAQVTGAYTDSTTQYTQGILWTHQ